MKFKLFTCFLFVFLFSATTFAQFKMSEFIIRKSSFQNDLKEIKAANPNITVEELVKAANELVQNKGVNFVFGFDEATCQKIATAKANQKDKTQPLNLRAKLVSVGGDGSAVPLVLPEANFDKSECLPCYMQLPIFEITPNDFVSSIMGTNIKFVLPKNFITQEIQLVDNTDVTKVIKTWKIPFLAEPLSISDDGNIIYLGFNEPELKDLTLLVFGEGVFSVGARKDINGEKKAIPLKNSPVDATKPNLTYWQFKEGETLQTVRFTKVCNN